LLCSLSPQIGLPFLRPNNEAACPQKIEILLFALVKMSGEHLVRGYFLPHDEP
jgi:hypothetical protein